MKVAEDTSVAAQVAIACLALCGVAGGWVILLGGGFHHTPYRRAGYTLFVDGGPALFMAALCFAWAAIGAVALLKIHRCSAWAYLLALGGLLALPLGFVLLRV